MGKEIQGISREAMEAILNYQWPGNVRELEHAIEYAFIVSPENRIALYHLPKEVSRPEGLHLMKEFVKSVSVDEVTRIREALVVPLRLYVFEREDGKTIVVYYKPSASSMRGSLLQIRSVSFCSEKPALPVCRRRSLVLCYCPAPW